MKIALALNEESTHLAPDISSCRTALVFDLAHNQITNQQTRHAALYVPLETHPLLSLLEDCTVLFAAAYDPETLHAISETPLRPLVISDPSLPLDQILHHLETESLKVRAPILHTHDEDDAEPQTEQEDQSE